MNHIHNAQLFARKMLVVGVGAAIVVPTTVGMPVSTSYAVEASDATGQNGSRPDYDATFRLSNDQITSVTSNTGWWGPNQPSRLIDGDTSTIWEINPVFDPANAWRPSLDFKFAETVDLDHFTFTPRPYAANYPTKMSIYASTSDSGEDFTLVHTAKLQSTTSAATVDFGQSHSFKRLRIVFEEAAGNRPSMSEINFYKTDTLTHQVNALFTDKTYSALTSGVTAEQVERLYTESLTHPSSTLTDLVNIARKLLAGDDYSSQLFVLPQDGDPRTYARDVLKMSNFASVLIPTGLAANPGDTITVYVDAAPGDPLPRIDFSQSMGAWNNWRSSVQLKAGVNVLTVPTLANPSGVTPGGAIYLENAYTPEQQSRAPKVRIEGAYEIPFFQSGDDVESFKTELTNYMAKREAEPDKYADVVEIANDWATATSTLSTAKTAYLDGTGDPQTALDFLETRYKQLLAFADVTNYTKDGGDPHQTVWKPRQNVRAMTMPNSGYWAYASSDHTGFNSGTMVNYFTGGNYGWGIVHELGHHLDPAGAYWPEVTNNMWSNYDQVVLSGGSDRITTGQYDTFFTNNVRDDYATNSQAVSDLGIFWQLYLYDKDYWSKYNAAVRDGMFSDLSTTERIVAISSYVIGFDLTEHFDRHHYWARRNVTDTAAVEASKAKIKEALNTAGVPDRPEDKKPWYMWTKAVNNETEFTDLTPPTLEDVTYKNGKVTVKVSDESARESARMGYEIIMDGKVVGFSRTGTFTFPFTDDGAEHEFKVRAFDTNSTPTEATDPVTVTLQRPTIAVSNNTVLPVGSSNDDLLSAITALDSDGMPLDFTADTSKVDLNTPGRYVVPVTATDADGRTRTKDVTFDIVSKATYLSDLPTVSESVGWRTLMRDRRIEANRPMTLQLVEGYEQPFAKGLVAHAASSVVYDLTDKNPQYFEAIIGIEGAVRSATQSNAIFKVIADGKVIYTSPEMTAKTDALPIKLDITGVKTLELVTDANGRSDSDHTAWALARISEYEMATQYNPAGTELSMPYGEAVTEDDIKAQLTDMAPEEKISSVTVGELPAANADGTVTVTIEYTDGSRDTVEVPVKVVPADYTALEAAVAAAREAEPLAYVSENGEDIVPENKWVTQAELDALKEAIAGADQVLTDRNLSQAQVDAKVAAVNAAIEAYKAAMEAGKPVSAVVPTEGPQAPEESAPALQVTRFVAEDWDGDTPVTTELALEEGLVGTRDFDGYVFDKTVETDYGQEHRYVKVVTSKPTAAPTADAAPELKVTRFVAEDGTEIADAVEGLVEHGSIDGYVFDKTVETDLGQDHVFIKLVTEVPDTAPTADANELKVTRFVDEAGNDIADAIEGLTGQYAIAGYHYDKTVQTEYGQDHVYVKIFTAIPETAPDDNKVELKITRYVDAEGNELADATEGLTDKQDIAGYTYDKTVETAYGQDHIYTKIVVPDPTPTAEPTASASATAEPTASASATAEPTASASATAEPTASASATAEPTFTAIPSYAPVEDEKPELIITPEPSASASATAEPTASASATAEPTASVSASATVEPTASASATAEPSASASATAEPTASASATAEPTASASATAEPTASASATAEPTASASATAEPTASASATAEPTASASATAEPTFTAIPSKAPVEDEKPELIITPEPTTSTSASAEPTVTAEPSATAEPSVSATAKAIAEATAAAPAGQAQLPAQTGQAAPSEMAETQQGNSAQNNTSVAPENRTAAQNSLAYTGAQVGNILTLGGFSILTGGIAFIAARRRKAK